jgi:hypothetical protein
LAAGEIGFESDTNKFKIGTGSTAWASLPYAASTSPLTTKGDLYTYSTADARLAVGANGETLVADSSTSTGLRYTAGTVQANPVINSAMQNWQRGTSIAIPSTLATYTADRWVSYRVATGMTVSRQTTSDTTNLPFIQYCARIARDSGNTSTEALTIYNIFESINSIPYAGKTVTLSFYARKGANFSSTTNFAVLKTGTGTDQNPFSGFTGDVNAILSSPTFTTTWARYTFTATLGSNITQIAVGFSLTNPTGTAGAADYLEVTGVQIDIGSVALPFRTYAGTIQGELAACQRYYLRFIGGDGNDILGTTGFGSSTTQAVIPFVLPTQMRITPSAIESSTVEVTDLVNEYAITITLGANSTSFLGIANCAATGLTQFRPYFLRNDNNAAGYVAFSAEL